MTTPLKNIDECHRTGDEPGGSPMGRGDVRDRSPARCGTEASGRPTDISDQIARQAAASKASEFIAQAIRETKWLSVWYSKDVGAVVETLTNARFQFKGIADDILNEKPARRSQIQRPDRGPDKQYDRRGNLE